VLDCTNNETDFYNTDINITYSKTRNASTKELTKIFIGWESSYVTLRQYLDVIKIYNPGMVTTHYFHPNAHGLIRFRQVFRLLDRLLKVSHIANHFLVLTVHICMKNTKVVCLLPWEWMGMMDCTHWPFQL